MARISSEAEKRKIDEFLKQYRTKRGLSEDQSCEASREAEARGEEARELYKIERDAAAIASGECADNCDVELLTQAEKYERRKVNNRKSAAAARVCKEVRKIEKSYALKRYYGSCKWYKKRCSELESKQRNIEKMNLTLLEEKEITIKALKGKIDALEFRLSSSSISSQCEDDAAAIDDALRNSQVIDSIHSGHSILS